MRVVHHLRDVETASSCHITIGVFDGVHLGHQRIIRGLVEAARGAGGTAVAITFDPHPAAVLGENPPVLLTTVGERIELMADLGLDTLVVFPFTEEVAHTSAGDFLDRVTNTLQLAELWVGPDFSLGHGRNGDVEFLRRVASRLGFRVRVVEPVRWGGGVVHSSRVRRALGRGDVEEATGCLGRPYRLRGVVVRGRGLGEDIGVPTANIAPPPNRLIPATGVYACWAHTERYGAFAAATNVGIRPTFAAPSSTSGLTVEAHLLDFDPDLDLYDQVLGIEFVARLRDERTYPTLNALVNQLHEDIAQTRAILSRRALAAQSS